MKKILLITLSLCAFICADEFVESSSSFGGYGEMHYDMEGNDGDGKLDFHRFIIYYKHQFDGEWSMMSEVEIEHNMVGSSEALGYKGGYVALEQAFLNYWNGDWGFKGGVLLVPAGITNEYHEPPTFMSVERPEYNKYIIPSTWFDNGFSFYGSMGDINWNYTMVGDLNGNDIGEGIRNGRMKGFGSSTSSWTKTLQASWMGMEGLKVGGSLTMNDAPADAIADSGDCGAGTEDCNNAITRDAVGVNLFEVNATYSKDNMYARLEYGSIDYTDNLHQTAMTTGLTEVSSSSGYYLDLGYNVADMMDCDGDLYVWTRTSSYSKNDDGSAKDISLFGVTFKPTTNVAIKFETGEAGDSDVMRMGLGYMF